MTARLTPQHEVEIAELIAAELPRRTGMHIDPNERWDVQATRKTLSALDDAAIIVRRDWLLTATASMPREHEAALFEYALHVSREMTKRRIGIEAGDRS